MAAHPLPSCRAKAVVAVADADGSVPPQHPARSSAFSAGYALGKRLGMSAEQRQSLKRVMAVHRDGLHDLD